MNKTVIININGTIFHIEEDAYEILKKYMTAIKLHFSSFEDSMEIITDIEHRIAEMFTEELALLQKEVITSIEVLKVTEKMGNPDQFAEEDTDFDTGYQAPAKPIKKLYRDIDKGKLAGVCAGIAHYFQINANWVRAAFLISWLFYGFGILLYILFWIITPKAKTRTEKMKMKGEAINLKGFQRNLEDEIGSLKESFSKNFSSGFRVAESKIGVLFSQIGSLIQSIIKLIVKIISFFFSIFISILIIALIICLLAFLGYSNNAELSTIFPINALPADYRTIVLLSCFLVALIPLVGLLLFVLRTVFKTNITKASGLNLLLLWILALGTGVYFISKNISNFKEEAAFSEAINLKPALNKTYYLQLGEQTTIEPTEISGTKTITIIGNDKDFDNPDNVKLALQLVDNGTPVLIKSYAARGKNFKSALENAKYIQYFYEQQDSILRFDYKANLKTGELWRAQEVKLTFKVPVGTTLYIQQDLAYRLLHQIPYACINDDKDREKFIKVVALKNGFTCKKTEAAISNQKERNLENNSSEEVSEELVF